MAKTKTSTEEIIEKKESSPVASASLILSCVAILASIVFCLLEIIDYRTGLGARAADSDNPAMMIAKEDLRTLKLRVNKIAKNVDVALPDDEDEEDEEDEDLDEDDEDFDEDEDDEDFDEDFDEDDEDFDEDEDDEDEEDEDL